MEIINLRLTAKLKSDKLPIKKIVVGTKDPAKALLRKHKCHFEGKLVETPVYDGLRLEAGNIIKGNAIIEEPTTTTVIPAGKLCTIDAFGNYIIVSET
jgi:N-methylhydantoinase A